MKISNELHKAVSAYFSKTGKFCAPRFQAFQGAILLAVRNEYAIDSSKPFVLCEVVYFENNDIGFNFKYDNLTVDEINGKRDHVVAAKEAFHLKGIIAQYDSIADEVPTISDALSSVLDDYCDAAIAYAVASMSKRTPQNITENYSKLDQLDDARVLVNNAIKKGI